MSWKNTLFLKPITNFFQFSGSISNKGDEYN
jgi:hypothetical protein